MRQTDKPQPDQELRVANQYRQDVERRLAALNIAPLDPVMASKFPKPGQLKTNEIQVFTNVYGMQLKQIPVYRYQVKIEGLVKPTQEGRQRPPIEFTGNVRGDPVCLSRRDDCRKIFTEILKTYRNDFRQPREHYYYDLKSILFTLEQLPIQDEAKYPIQTTPDFFGHCLQIVVTIQKVTDKFELFVGDIKTFVGSDLSNYDRSLQQFLEIAISQPVYCDPKNHIVINGGASYFVDPTKAGFSSRDIPSLKEGKYLSIGAEKSVRFVEGPRGPGWKNAAVIINPKRTPFHQAQALIEKVKDMIRIDRNSRVATYDIENLRRGLKGLYVRTIYKETRLMRITDVINETARNTILTELPGHVTMVDYFKQKYNITINYPEAPLIGIRVPKFKDGIMKFPLEVLNIVGNQRVTTEQQSREQIAQQIRACAVLPAVQKEQIEKCAKAISLFNNAHLNSAEIKVIPNPLSAKARMLPQPSITYGNGAQPINPDDRGTWRANSRGRGQPMQTFRFLIPAKCNKWEAYLIDPRARDGIDDNQLNEFLRRFVAEAQKRGMQVGSPSKIGKMQPDERSLKETMENAIRNNVEFIFFIHAGRDTHIHGMIKYFELKGIITQDLKSITAANVVQKNQTQTMENIVMKTNIKLGGLNNGITIQNPEILRMFGKEVLYIGFGTNHPGGGFGSENAPPTVIGFSANDNPNPMEFTGDYIYQETRRDEKVDVIKDIICKILDRYVKNRGGTPKCVIIYRNGCSEGQFKDVISYEIPFIKLAFKEKGCDPKLIVIVPNKKHSIRFLPSQINGDRAPDQNVKPGTIIDTQVVHPSWNEFYLCSHTTLQGTAKVPRYTIIYSDSTLTADQVQEATFALSYVYQTVRLPTSLPVPAYIAEKYAERGRTILKAHTSSETSQIQGPLENEFLNQQITLANNDLLRGKRINA